MIDTLCTLQELDKRWSMWAWLLSHFKMLWLALACGTRVPEQGICSSLLLVNIKPHDKWNTIGIVISILIQQKILVTHSDNNISFFFLSCCDGWSSQIAYLPCISICRGGKLWEILQSVTYDNREATHRHLESLRAIPSVHYSKQFTLCFCIEFGCSYTSGKAYC